MPLNTAQTKKIDDMIEANAKGDDIIQELVSKHGASVRDVKAYLGEEKTLQGMLNTITRRSKDIRSAGTEQERTAISKEIEALGKKAVRIVQKKAGQ